MVQVQLTPEELQLLSYILEQQLVDLRTEIADTDTRDYKKMLKDQQKLLVQLLEKVQSSNKATTRV
jgi:hypothetical protein